MLAIIPARGGSKGIPKKNIISLAGKPLIQHTIDAAKESSYIDNIFISTDSNEVLAIAKKNYLDTRYRRPSLLADDYATTVDVVLDVLVWLKDVDNYTPDSILLLQPTSPLRSVGDIDKSIKQFIKGGKNCLVGVHEMVEHPYECVTGIKEDNWAYLAKQGNLPSRRQDYNEAYYYINGAIYLVDTDFFKKEQCFIKEKQTDFYVMPQERGVDIDGYSDLKMAEYIINNEA